MVGFAGSCAPDPAREVVFAGVVRTGDGLRVKRDNKIESPKVLAVHLLQPDCLQCRAQLEALRPLHERYASQGLLILGISHRGDEKDLAALQRELKIPFPLLLGTGSELAGKFAAGDTLGLIDADGLVRFAQVGYGKGDEKVWEENIDQMIAGRPPVTEGVDRERLKTGDSFPAVVLPSLHSGKPMSLTGRNGRLVFRDDTGRETQPRGVLFFFSRY